MNELYYKDRTPLSPCPPGGAVMNYFSIVLEQVEVFVVYPDRDHRREDKRAEP